MELLDKDLGNEVYKNKKNLYEKKFEENKSASQVNFLGDFEFWAVLATYKNMTGETQKSLIQRAVYEVAKKENPKWFKDLKIENKE